MAAVDLTEEQIDRLTDVETLEFALSVGLLVEEERGFPELVRVRLKRALQ
jgi:hypothetical protein